MNIPLPTIESIFKKAEVPAELFSMALTALEKHGTDDKADTEKTANFLIALGKASNFDMTLMFINDDDKKILFQILFELKQNGNKDLTNKFESIYGAL